MKVTAYVRVSAGKQAEQGPGPDVQRHAIAVWAKEHGHKIVSWHADIGARSGNALDGRSGLPDAWQELTDHKAEGIVFYKLDRLAGDVILQESLLRDIRRLGCHAYSTFAGEQENMENDPQDPSRKMIRVIIGAVSDYEREIIRLRLHNGRRRKAERGGYAYGGPPYGYQALSGELVPVEREQAVLARMAELRASGASLRQIADILNSEGIAPRRGTWHPQTVSRALERTARERASAAEADCTAAGGSARPPAWGRTS
jgi:DNA invertase Pin-like site-specific DNA recombinase